ncbi:ATP-binding protein [Streptomyces sp. NPDC055099]
MPVPVATFRQRLSSTPRGARLARRLARYHLDEWGVPYGSEVSEAVAQIVAELAANAVTHGRVPGRDFEVRMILGGGVLRVEVGDTWGEGGAALAVRVAASDAESGRGLLLVAALADAWGVVEREVGKTVWAEITLPSPGPCPSPA